MLFKGISYLNTIAFFKHYFGEDGYQKILSHLCEDHRRIYESTIFATEWYTLEVELNTWAIMIRDFNQGDESILLEQGGWTAEQNLKGIYRTFIRLGSPEYLVKKATVVTNAYFQGVTGEVEIVSPGKMFVRYRGFEPRHRLIELIILGWVSKALELTGVKNLKGEITTSLSENKEFVEFCYAWNK